MSRRFLGEHGDAWGELEERGGGVGIRGDGFVVDFG